MPRTGKGPRLYLEPEELDKAGRIVRRSSWVVRDGSRKLRTGCAPQDREGAERFLGDYIASKYQPDRTGNRHPSKILIADVLAIYLTDCAPKHAREAETKQRVLQLDEWWSEKTLAAVNGQNCRAYVTWRTSQPWKAAKPKPGGKPPRMVSTAAARRELEDLRAAINHHRTEGLCSEIVAVSLPDKPEARERWLTRSEAARMIWSAWRYREKQQGVRTDRASRRHIARFILVGLYTGTRSGAICGAATMPTVGRGYVDYEAGVFYRQAIGRRKTKKRQLPVKLPRKLLNHMRRWREIGASNTAVIEWNGSPVEKVGKAFGRVVADAGLGPEVTPHILRHTCATWLMQAGVDVWEAAGFLAMTVKQLEETYGHHHPDYQEEAVEALSGQKRDRNPVNKAGQTSPNSAKIIDLSRAAK
jgi:integrase